VAAFVIGHFQGLLQSATILASFIPIVMATAGNAGIQSATIAVRGIASGEIWASDWLRRVGKEMLVALVNGLAASILLGLAVFVITLAMPGMLVHPVRLVWTAGLSLIAVIVLATTIGASVPVVLDRMGIDPALATGPFIMASNDVIGILVFFLLAQALYL
jgi:magnesium transporter